MAPVIVLKNLYKCYAGFAPVLRGANMEVEAGELVAIMGPSGCGKSTMLHVLGLLHAPDSGSLEILGTDITALSREQGARFRRNNLGFVMQSSNLFDHSTVFENVEFPLIYEGVPPQERWERVIRALELVRLSARVHYRSNRLSGGEQQRVAIARAMVNNPRILLADEPTGALDARTSRLIMDNFRTLCHSGGVSMVMVTHDPKMAEFCDSIYTLEEGVLHCQRRELKSLQSEITHNLLDSPPPVLRGALVAERFPENSGQCLMEEAHRMHAAGLLSRIYALSDTGFLGNPEGYALPLAVRRIGGWRFFSVCASLFRQTRGAASHTLWHLWQHLPLRARWGRAALSHLWAFGCGVVLARWALEEKIEFIYASGGHGPATASWVAASLLNVPFAFAVRTSDLARPGNDWQIKASQAAFVRCDTQATRQALQELLPDVAPERLVLMRDPLTISLPDEEPEMPPKGGPILPPQLLAVGSICPRKGYDLLLRACAELHRQGQDFQLTIVGQGPSRLSLRWLSRRLGLGGKVKFRRHVPHDQMADLYKKSDIFVAPGRKTRTGDQDGLPSALAEAMALGLAVVASALPGQAEALVNGKNGLLVPCDDAPALALALKRLLDNTDERRSLGSRARADIYTLLDDDKTEARMLELFEQGRAAAGKS